MTFKDIPLKEKGISLGKKPVQWNTKKEHSWEKYKTLTTNNFKLENLANSSIEDTDIFIKK